MGRVCNCKVVRETEKERRPLDVTRSTLKENSYKP